MIVHSEGDQSEHSHIEVDMPPGVDSLNVVLVLDQFNRASGGREIGP